MIKIEHFIDGEYTSPASGEYFDNIDPATGTIYSEVARGNKDDISRAVIAAEKAFPHWSGLSVNQRSRVLHKIADLIGKYMDKLVEAESLDNGKPLKLAKTVDIPRAKANFRFFANLIMGQSAESYDMPSAINYTLRQPLGAVACISPWNLPLYLFSWKIAPAMASGNTVVAKPSEITPYSAYLLGEICNEADLPKGVLNIVQGYGHEAGQALVDHKNIKAISFTGGTATGKKIAQTVAPEFKKLSLELGGKNPNIIFADAPYDEMLNTTVRSSFANQGQICLCGSRILVQENIYQQFREDFVETASNLKVGDPKDEENFMGAMVSKDHFEKVMNYIELAKEEGGTILTGGKAVQPAGRCKNGYFIRPTIIEGLTHSCRTVQEEIFGPVVTLHTFTDEEEAIELANNVRYGLSTSLWTQNLSRAHRMAKHIQAGVVWVNTWLHRDLRTPFGGMKHSGVGREGGFEALRFFTEAKNICIKY
jgi:aminomuconate-semialdehyde/2-hydroxymuconate-6-semialdehyde dehydrogenase